VKHNLKDIRSARFIRFLPTLFSTRKALRVEVFGVLKPAGILLEALTTATKINCKQGLISNCLNPADMVVRKRLYFVFPFIFTVLKKVS